MFCPVCGEYLLPFLPTLPVGSIRSARPLQQVASLHSSARVLTESGGKPGDDSHEAIGGDGKEASSGSGSKKAPPIRISMTEKDKPDPLDLVS